MMGIDVKLGYYRGKLTSYEAIKHLYLAQQAGIGETNDERGYPLDIYNFEEAPKVYFVSEYWSKHNDPKTYEHIQQNPYLAYYPDYVEIHTGDYQYGSWWIESLTGIVSRSVNWNKIIPRHFYRHELGIKLPERRWVRYHESLDNKRRVWVDEREEFDFPICKNQKLKFDYKMMPISELPKFPKYKVNRKKMNLVRKSNADFPQYVEAMFKLLPLIDKDWISIAEEDKHNDKLDKRYRMFLSLILEELQFNGYGYYNPTSGGYKIELSNLLQRADWQLKRSHPEVLDKVQ